MNRLQSGDLRTFHSLQSPSPIGESFAVLPQTDEAELERLKDLGRLSGLGEEIYDDEFHATAAEFGIDLSDGETPDPGIK